MDGREDSPAAALKEKLSKSRRPTQEEPTTSTSQGSSIRQGSTDSASIASKIKSRIHNIDEDENGDSKIAKLIPGRSKRKEKRRQEVERLALDSSEELRGRDRSQDPALAALGTGESQSTLEDGEHSILITDSEDDL